MPYCISHLLLTEYMEVWFDWAVFKKVLFLFWGINCYSKEETDSPPPLSSSVIGDMRENLYFSLSLQWHLTFHNYLICSDGWECCRKLRLKYSDVLMDRVYSFGSNFFRSVQMLVRAWVAHRLIVVLCVHSLLKVLLFVKLANFNRS